MDSINIRNKISEWISSLNICETWECRHNDRLGYHIYATIKSEKLNLLFDYENDSINENVSTWIYIDRNKVIITYYDSAGTEYINQVKPGLYEYVFFRSITTLGR